MLFSSLSEVSSGLITARLSSAFQHNRVSYVSWCIFHHKKGSISDEHLKPSIDCNFLQRSFQSQTLLRILFLSAVGWVTQQAYQLRIKKQRQPTIINSRSTNDPSTVCFKSGRLLTFLSIEICVSMLEPYVYESLRLFAVSFMYLY